MIRRPANLLPLFAGCALLALAACAPDAPPPATTGGDPALAARCRAEAERLVLFRDRGQTMRNEEMDTRSGTFTPATANAQSDRLGQSFERDRIAAECIRRGQEAAATATPRRAN